MQFTIQPFTSPNMDISKATVNIIYMLKYYKFLRGKKMLKILHIEVCKWIALVTSTEVDFDGFYFFPVFKQLFFSNAVLALICSFRPSKVHYLSSSPVLPNRVPFQCWNTCPEHKTLTAITPVLLKVDLILLFQHITEFELQLFVMVQFIHWKFQQ